MRANPATIGQYLSGAYSNQAGSSSAEVLAKVSKTLESQNTVAPKLNAALASDNTKLSGLGKLMSSLSSFQSIAQSFSATTSSTSAAPDATQLKTQIVGFFAGLNTLNATLNGLRDGDLKSDQALSSVRTQLAQVFNGSNASTTSAALANIGISVAADGTWNIDQKKLQGAIDANAQGVSDLFANHGKGIADGLAASLKDMVSGTGSIAQEQAALNKDIASLNQKRSTLEKSLTAQAQALVKLYATQGSSGPSGGRSTLLDMLG